jgi:hypothetical protein
MTDQLEQLGARLRDGLGDGPPEEQLRAQRHATLDRLVAPPRRSWRWVWFAAPALAAAAAVAIVVALPGEDAPRRTLRCHDLRGGELLAGHWLAARPDPVAVRFTDRSELTVERGGRLRLDAIDDTRVRLSLETGRMTTAVRSPHHAVEWMFLAGPYSVQVLGTELAIEWKPEESKLVVEVAHGVVRVKQDRDDEGVRVRAGERYEATVGKGFVVRPRGQLADNGAAPVAPAEVEPAIAPSVEPAVEPAATEPAIEPASPAVEPAPRVAPAPSTAWTAHARGGAYDKALAAARAHGLAKIFKQGSAEDLLLLADAARLAGAEKDARDAALALRTRFAGTADAAMAAFRLGRLAFDRDQHRDAAMWFATYRAEAPSGALAEQAHGRQLDALLRAGDRAAATKVAREYLDVHPQGAYRALAQQTLRDVAP